MSDTKVQGTARADEVITGIYSVYIDQDNQPDGFTVKNDYTEPTDQNYPKRDMYLNNVGKCQPELDPGLKPNSDLGPKLGLVSILSLTWPFGDHSGNSFELASGKPLNETTFRNAYGEELKVGDIIEIRNEESDKFKFEIRIYLGFDDHKNSARAENPKWKILGFKIAGFTDDPDRKNIENMSKIPDEKRKYAVIDVEIVSTDVVVSYKKDSMKCAPDGTCETTPVYETRTAPLNDLRSEGPSKYGVKGLSKPEFFLGSPSFKF